MAEENNFKSTVKALFEGMDSVVSSKTVVGDAIHINGTIILPLVDVSFGIGAGSFLADKKEKRQKTASRRIPTIFKINRSICNISITFLSFHIHPAAQEDTGVSLHLPFSGTHHP